MSRIGIQNGVHPGRVIRFVLDSSLSHITGAEVLETYNPMFGSPSLGTPTTGALRGNSFLVMANPQTRQRFSAQGVQDSTSLTPVRTLRLPLRP